MWEIFEKLMNKESLSISDAARKCGCAPSTLTDWRAGRSKPKADKLLDIAHAFGVSMEYIMTGVKTQSEPLSDDERKLLHLFRSLTSDGKIAALERIEEMATSDKWTKEKTDIQAG